MAFTPFVFCARSFWITVVGISLLLSEGRAMARDLPASLVRVRSASRSLPMLAAIAQGYFSEENLEVDYTQFASSRPTFIQVDTREIEIIISSMDNAINYQLNPNNPAGRILDNVIIAAHDVGLGLALAAAPGFATAESLRGQRVGVDVPHSGFGLPAERILLERGLVADIDYALVAAGSTPARFQGLLEGQWEAVIINAEGIVRARAAGLPVIEVVANVVQPYQGGIVAAHRGAGLPVIEVVANVVQPYQGGIVAAHRGWLEENADVAVRFLRGFARGMIWVFERSNRAAAIELLVDEETTAELAANVYDLNIGADGLAVRAALNPEGIRNVLALRNQFNGFETPQDLGWLASPAGGLYDVSYYERAVRGLASDDCH